MDSQVRPILPKASQSLEGSDFVKKFGQIGLILNKSGYGWLLEQDELPKSDIPIMNELDIDLNEIWYKIRCVLLPLPQVNEAAPIGCLQLLSGVTRSTCCVIIPISGVHWRRCYCLPSYRCGAKGMRDYHTDKSI